MTRKPTNGMWQRAADGAPTPIIRSRREALREIASAKQSPHPGMRVPERHEAHGDLEVRLNRATGTVDTQPPSGIGHDHAASGRSATASMPDEAWNASSAPSSCVTRTDPSTAPLTRSRPVSANATALTAAGWSIVRNSRPPGSSYIWTTLPRAIATRSPPSETTGTAEVKPSPSMGLALGSSASGRPCTVSHTRVGRSRQLIATTWPAISARVLTPQSSPIGSDVQRRYGELASQTLAVPSQEAPTTRRALEWIFRDTYEADFVCKTASPDGNTAIRGCE